MTSSFPVYHLFSFIRAYAYSIDIHILIHTCIACIYRTCITYTLYSITISDHSALPLFSLSLSLVFPVQVTCYYIESVYTCMYINYCLCVTIAILCILYQLVVMMS